MLLWKLLKSFLNFSFSMKSFLTIPASLIAGTEPDTSFFFSQCFMSKYQIQYPVKHYYPYIMPVHINIQFLKDAWTFHIAPQGIHNSLRISQIFHIAAKDFHISLRISYNSFKITMLGQIIVSMKFCYIESIKVYQS